MDSCGKASAGPGVGEGWYPVRILAGMGIQGMLRMAAPVHARVSRAVPRARSLTTPATGRTRTLNGNRNDCFAVSTRPCVSLFIPESTIPWPGVCDITFQTALPLRRASPGTSGIRLGDIPVQNTPRRCALPSPALRAPSPSAEGEGKREEIFIWPALKSSCCICPVDRRAFWRRAKSCAPGRPVSKRLPTV